MQIKCFSYIFLLLLCLAKWSSFALSHADHEKARFISPDGNDIGKCDDPENPCKTLSYAGLKSQIKAIGFYYLRVTILLMMLILFFIY